jgi:hypothetical protein
MTVKRTKYATAVSGANDAGRHTEELRKQIDDVIARLKKIQKAIAGSRQPASMLELESMKELGRRYAALDKELKDWLKKGS